MRETSFNCDCYFGKPTEKHSKIDINIEKTMCQLSYKDIILLFETIFYQIEQVKSSKKEQEVTPIT